MVEVTNELHPDVLWYALAAVFLPLVSFFTSLSISERYSWLVSMKANGLLLGSLFCALKTGYLMWHSETTVFVTTWFSIGGNEVNAGIELSKLSLTMLIVVAAISFLVHIYSSGYMAEDRGTRRYFAMLGFFTFSMQGLILADSLLLLFLFWELVGFSSYMLIGHWWDSPHAGQAAKKAFVMNRVGDLGFIIGLMIIWAQTSTFSISDLLMSESSQWQTAAMLLIFLGVVGKSAQFPLFTWLPDAMVGPTPVSALIHAATMVAAGVYLLIRLAPIIPPDALMVISIVGMLSALAGSVAALAQFDLKRILAYSTISQLGLMVMAIGAGAAEAAFAHLIAHAFFKACLFLSAGSVIHAMHRAEHRAHLSIDAQDIRYMGGLRKNLPVTFVSFLASAASLAGLPLFSGFLSKEAIFVSILQSASNEKWILIAALLLVSMLTILYTFRMFWSVFMGTPRHPITSRTMRAPGVMRMPLIALGAASLWFTVAFNPLDATGWLWQAHENPGGWVTLVSLIWVALAVGIAFALFRKNPYRAIGVDAFASFIDWFYQRSFVKLTTAASHLADRLDRKWIDGFVHANAYAQITLSFVTAWFDRTIIDGLATGSSRLVSATGAFIRSFQSGKIQLYVFWAILATVIFLIWTLE